MFEECHESYIILRIFIFTGFWLPVLDLFFLFTFELLLELQFGFVRKLTIKSSKKHCLIMDRMGQYQLNL